MSFIQILLSTGPIIWIILLCSIFAWGIILNKLWHLHYVNIETKKFLNVFFNYLKNNQIKKTIKLCDSSSIPLAGIFKSGILKYDSGIQEIKQAMQDASSYEIATLEKNLSALITIAYISPLLGILGLVFAMLRVFGIIQTEAVNPGPINILDIASKIWQGLILLAFGLILAITVFLMYNYLLSRINSLILDMEKIATEVANRFSLTTKASITQPEEEG